MCTFYCEDLYSYEECVNNPECGWCDETSLCSQHTSKVCADEHYYTNGHATNEKDELEDEVIELETGIYILSESMGKQNEYTHEAAEEYAKDSPEETKDTGNDWQQHMNADFE